MRKLIKFILAPGIRVWKTFVLMAMIGMVVFLFIVDRNFSYRKFKDNDL